MAAVASGSIALAGTRHVSLVEARADGPALVTADVRADAADPALAALEALGVTPGDIALVRLDTIPLDAGGGEATALIWADVLGQARMQARAPARYLVLMAAAGVIAAFGVINDSATLIVGAMAISPDLLPVTAACTGLVLRRPRLVRRGLAHPDGRARRGRAARLPSSASFLDQLDLLPRIQPQRFSAAQTHVNSTTILVALAAGVAACSPSRRAPARPSASRSR